MCFWLFCLSLLFNLVGLFYVRWLIKAIETINGDVETLRNMIIDFSEHTKSVYELEMFYGDETLQSLMSHAKELSETLIGLDLVLNEEIELAEED
mgnify:CR=1 FL=1